MDASHVALLVSCLSLVVSGISLGWNIYKEVYLRARVRTSFQLMTGLYPLAAAPTKPMQRFVILATNLGPGKVSLQTLVLIDWSIWKQITRTYKYLWVCPDFKHPLGGKLPIDLDVGQKTQLSFEPNDCKFLLEEKFTYFGICDSFGRMHWCRKADLISARAAYRELTASPGRSPHLSDH